MTEAAITSEARPALGSRINRFAGTIILGHALKHVYISGLAAVLLPEIKDGLALSSTQYGTLATVQQTSSWGSTMTSGYLGDRFTRLTAIMLGLSLALTGVSYFFLGIAESYAFLLPAMLLVGIGPSLYHPPAIGALSRRFTSARAFMISMHGAGGSLGEATGPLLAGGLVAVMYYQDVLRLSVIPALIAAFAMWTLLKGDSAQHADGARSFREYVGSFMRLLRHQTILLICTATAFRTVGQATATVFLPVYLKEDLGYSAALTGLFISMAQVVGIGSQPLMGHLSDRLGYKRVLVPALVTFALLLLLIPVADSKLQLAIVILLLGTFLFSLHAILISAASELTEPSMQSTIVSLIYASSFVGALSPTLAGVLADTYGLKSTFLLAASLVGTSSLILMLTNLPKARSRAAA
ncbi:MAG TPA: MFS transporter [Dehalococcoidia bacterium]|jgi:FSR family fosmidomycin resistance protein-like MFS transporter